MIERHIHRLTEQSLELFPVVLINGARQVGKSTLAQQMINKNLIDDYVTLDDLTVLQAVHDDPEGFISSVQGRIAIDEIQRAPQLLLAIKKFVDANKSPGQFLLTGSANILSHSGAMDSLAGRMDIIDLEGLSFNEINNQDPSTFFADIFSTPNLKEVVKILSAKKHNKVDKKVINERILFGCFPDINIKNNDLYRKKWLSAYQKSYIEKDVRDLSKNTDIITFANVVRLLSYQSAQLLNFNNLAVSLGVDNRTLTRYVEILEVTFQANRLYPWHKNTRKRYVKTPKIFFNDTGLACHYIGIENKEKLPQHRLYGSLMETWIWSEFRKMIQVSNEQIQSYFYRTHLGKEVDFVFENGELVYGIEIKSAASVSQKDLQGLKDFCDAIGPQARGLILYFGDNVVGFNEQIAAVPLSKIF